MLDSLLMAGVRATRRFLTLGLLLFVSATAPHDAGGEQTPTPWDLSRLMSLMAQVPTVRANFIEKKYMAVLTSPLTLSGTLFYSRPGRLEKHVLSPYEEYFLVDGDNLTLENKSKGQKRTLALQNYPVAWAFVESIRATLAGDLPALKRFYRDRLEGNQRQWTLILEPLDQDMAGYVQFIAISGAETHIIRIEVSEAGGDRSVMTVNGHAS